MQKAWIEAGGGDKPIWLVGGARRVELAGQLSGLDKSLPQHIIQQLSPLTHFFKDLHHKVRIYKEYNSVCPLVGIGSSPTPRPQASVPPHTRLRARSWSPNSDDLRKSFALCLHCGLHSAIMLYSCLVANFLTLLRWGKPFSVSGISSFLYLFFLWFIPVLKKTQDFRIRDSWGGFYGLSVYTVYSLFNLRSFDLSPDLGSVGDRDILVRIRIPGSVPLTNGSGSDIFLH
jgi:hypothetical protein